MKRSFWKRYYYDYLESLASFLVPSDAKTLRLRGQNELGERGSLPQNIEKYDYVVATDILGNIEDIELFLRSIRENILLKDGRVVITQYNALWEPILRLASILGLRKAIIEQNWLNMADIKNFAYLAGLETVKSGTKMLLPVYIPILSFLINKFLANIWPFSRLGLFHYLVLRKGETLAEGRKPSFTIVVPARNEAGTIEKIAQELPDVGEFTEIIFIEGNSTDNTYDEIKRVADKFSQTKKIKYGRQDGKGKGDAVRKGFDMATGDILAIYDADMTVPSKDVKKFYECIVANRGDFINGSRLVYPMQKESMRVLNFFGNKFFSLAFSWILGQTLKDTLCGTKVLWRSDYEKIKRGRKFFGDFDPFGDFDLLFGAAKLNLKIIDLPVHYQDRTYGTTNISRWKHGWLLLKMTVFAARKIKFI